MAVSSYNVFLLASGRAHCSNECAASIMSQSISSCGVAHDAGRNTTAKVIRHKRSSTRILKDWFDANLTHPYPTEPDKSSLAERSGLTTRQVSSWFTNARRRHPRRSSDPALAHSQRASSSSLPSLPTAIPVSSDVPLELMTPMDRWRNSPPDEEPSSWTAISEAVSSSSLDWHIESDSCLALSASSSASSARSHSSNGSWNLGSLGGHYKRRRRKTQKASRTGRFDSTKAPDRDPQKIYQCTFCTDTFKSRYDWTRHEGTLHLVLERWSCLPFGPRFLDPHDSTVRCALCNIREPTESHILSHNYQKCAARPASARTFLRKDHLRQHLRSTHGIDNLLDSMSAWKIKLSRINSRCGFCDERFQLWSDRNDHLVDHFRNGALMKDWKGCRGLDPAVALSVENAIPPYLIGQQSTDPEPFSASTTAHAAGREDKAPVACPSKFELLTADLGQFVLNQKELGAGITDEDLRRKARFLLYDDDDPWNYTPADNAEWLGMFKVGYGLLDSSSPQSTEVATLSAPFTVERMAHAADSAFSSGMTRDLLQTEPSTTCSVPWQWQTPECLKEFREMMSADQAMEIVPSGHPGMSTSAHDAASLQDHGGVNEVLDFSWALDWDEHCSQ